MNRVIRYDEDGSPFYFPRLQVGRRLHACSSYKDDYGATVIHLIQYLQDSNLVFRYS